MPLLVTLVLAIATLAAGCMPELVRTSFADRSTTTPLPMAPPPMITRGGMDLSVRQSGAFHMRGGEEHTPGATGVSAARTDGAISLRLSRYAGLRVIPGASYGDVTGTSRATVPFSRDGGGGGAFGGVFGYWDPRAPWSVVLEIDTGVVIVPSNEEWIVEERMCMESPKGEFTCTPFVERSRFHALGFTAAPTFAATLDASYDVTPWLRLGGGVGITSLVTRQLEAAIGWSPVGVGRAFAELRLEDTSVTLEAQQLVAEGLVMAPTLAITVSGRFLAVGLRRAPRADHAD